MITDKMLRRSALLADEAILDTLSRTCTEEYQFSEKFERRVKKLCRRADHPHFYAALNLAASFILAMFLAGGVWLSVDTQARAAFIQWVREVYEEHILYRYFNDSQQATLPTYEITSLPDGYTLTDSIVDETSSIHIFMNGDNVLIFTYYAVSEDSLTSLLFFDGYTHELVSVGSYSADYYAAKNSSECNELVWINSENNILFQISSFLDKTEILQIANSIALSKK